ncbi:MAG: YitT family protein, partial [Chitinophagaceae bacterium]|nr:YitT family protein [Chitinophagaceae bacterium]
HSHIHKPSFSENVQDAFFIMVGVVIASFALKNFLVPNHFFDGGVTGISLLTHEVYQFNLGIIIVLFNLPLVIISYFSVGKSFAIKTFISVILLGVCLVLIPNYAVTSDKLLIAIFGGVFLGIGIGLVMRAGAALDGIEVLALYTLKKTSFTITEIILGINILIFSIAAIKVGVENALYSILTYFAATRSIDYVVEGLQAHTGVTIISAESETIKYELVNKLGRGITVYKGQRGFLPGNFEVSADCDIIFTVISRLEIRKLKNLVYDVDPKAFVFASTIKEASGGILQRRHKH